MSGSGEVKETRGGTAMWEKENKAEPLRQPKVSGITHLGSKETSMQAGEQPTGASHKEVQKSLEEKKHTVLNSKLNVNATEFVPSTHQNQSNENQSYQTEDNNVVVYLKSMLGHLTLNPGDYEQVVNPVGDALQPVVADEAVRNSICDVIVDECILESNLRYSGARLCSDLIHKFGPPFRASLLNRCSLEHIKSLHRNDVLRNQGFGMLLAELFLQLQIENKSINILGTGLMEILQHLLNCENDGSVKCVCQILKLAGMKLDETDSRTLDQLFERLKNISTYPDLDPNVKIIVRSVIDMRATKWGHCISYPPPPAVMQGNIECTNEPVFYGPDGQVISEEETSFLQENVPFSEDADDYECEPDQMDDEAYSAYEQFLSLKVNSPDNRQ